MRKGLTLRSSAGANHPSKHLGSCPHRSPGIHCHMAPGMLILGVGDSAVLQPALAHLFTLQEATVLPWLHPEVHRPRALVGDRRFLSWNLRLPPAPTSLGTRSHLPRKASLLSWCSELPTELYPHLRVPPTQPASLRGTGAVVSTTAWPCSPRRRLNLFLHSCPAP